VQELEEDSNAARDVEVVINAAVKSLKKADILSLARVRRHTGFFMS
jgi:hypothetical protein